MESIKKEAHLMKVQWNGGNKYQVLGSFGDQETYSHKVKPINGTNYWEKSTCPTTLLPPKHHVQVGRPKKKRKRSKHEDEPFVKDEPAVGQAGSGGSGVGAIIGLFATDYAGGAGVGVGSQGSSHSRWTKRRV
ncbi:hypothetical protein Tco_0436289 [Tanacetum coccineum]